uniref:Sulfotransferase domain-containing protein n=1 Tax=Odontella aurita TaxID=265563 RepID=A0A7S4J233_9STRA|mmetsp:Transcript_36205/g.108456  ORF Transcript_36205/g.108456 Transcript_36205/m.108456 type:complete len:512 (+) Transcript_36205:552-2087(+)
MTVKVKEPRFQRVPDSDEEDARGGSAATASAPSSPRDDDEGPSPDVGGDGGDGDGDGTHQEVALLTDEETDSPKWSPPALILDPELATRVRTMLFLGMLLLGMWLVGVTVLRADDDGDGDDAATRMGPRGRAPDESEIEAMSTDNSAAALPTADLLPPLDTLLSGTDSDSEIIGDVSFLLDFAIVGYAKGGTTFLMNYLRKGSDETWVNNGEVHDMSRGHPANIVSLFYDAHLNHPPDHKAKKSSPSSSPPVVKYGYKSPEDLETPDALPLFQKYFPKTKLIVSIRHPVKWFESFYNFRVYHHPEHTLPPPNELIGPCFEGTSYPSMHGADKPEVYKHKYNGGVCTDRANLHWPLSRLGKTPMDTQEEKDLLQHDMDTHELPNEVFLMEDRQIRISEPASKHITTDLRDFLGLTTDLPDLQPYEAPADKYGSAEDQDAASRTIRICDEEHAPVREILVQHGRDASEWITTYFLQSPDVTVSSRKLFVKLLEDWKKDPCDDNDRAMRGRALW